MSASYDRFVSTGIGAAVAMVVLAVGVGLALGLLTKAAMWLYLLVTDVIWEWLPGQLGIDSEAFLFMAVVLVLGGVLVGIGQQRLGYLPKPLEETTAEVAAGHGIDYRTIPAVLGNTLPSLGAGAPLGPESGLIAVVGGIYFWLKERMDRAATRAYRVLAGAEQGEATKPWRSAPSLIADITLMVTFHRLPGGMDLPSVPGPTGDELGLLVLALAAGVAGGVLGIVTRRLEGHVRGMHLYDVVPLVGAPVAGLAVAILAVPSSLVLFSGAEEMADLFSGSVGAGELLYAGVAKLVAVLLVLMAGWKGGTVFPLMFIAGALAVGIAELTGLDVATLYAASVAGAVAGTLRSPALGAIIALLVVPPSLLLLMVVGALGGAVALRGAAQGSAAQASAARGSAR